MNIKTIIASILCLLLINFLYNLYYYFLAKYYYSKYVKHIEDGGWFIRENKQNIKKLFLLAGIKDSLVSNVEPVGYGMLQTGSVSVFENTSILRKDIFQITNGNFREAISVFKNRIVNTFNPFAWIEFIIFLPKYLFSYLGMKPESLFIKIIQLTYWLIGLLGTVISIFFNQQLINWIKTL